MVDVDTDRKETVQIGKPDVMQRPRNREEASRMIIDDMATLCEGICTLMHLGERTGARSSAESLWVCIRHLTEGFASASYTAFETHDEQQGGAPTKAER